MSCARERRGARCLLPRDVRVVVRAEWARAVSSGFDEGVAVFRAVVVVVVLLGWVVVEEVVVVVVVVFVVGVDSTALPPPPLTVAAAGIEGEEGAGALEWMEAEDGFGPMDEAEGLLMAVVARVGSGEKLGTAEAESFSSCSKIRFGSKSLPFED